MNYKCHYVECEIGGKRNAFSSVEALDIAAKLKPFYKWTKIVCAVDRDGAVAEDFATGFLDSEIEMFNNKSIETFSKHTVVGYRRIVTPNKYNITHTTSGMIVTKPSDRNECRKDGWNVIKQIKRIKWWYHLYTCIRRVNFVNLHIL